MVELLIALFLYLIVWSVVSIYGGERYIETKAYGYGYYCRLRIAQFARRTFGGRA